MIRSLKQAVPLVVLAVTTTLALWVTPREVWNSSFADACHVALIGGLATALALAAASFLGDRGVAFERATLAVFLGAMPLVYVASWFGSSSLGLPKLGFEMLAVPAYGTLAVLGIR